MTGAIRRFTEKALGFITDLAEKLIRKLFKTPPRPLDSREKISELVSYCVFGALTTLVSFISYLILAALFHLDSRGEEKSSLLSLLSALFSGEGGSYALHALWCQLGSWVCAVLFAFFTNKAFVFRSREHGKGALKELGRFALARVTGFIVIEAGVYLLLLGVLGHLADKILVTVLVVIFNYFASKFAVFGHKKKKDPSGSREELS